MMRVTLLLLTALLLNGCAAVISEHSQTILLKKDTGEKAQCSIDKLRTHIALQRYKECISSYEAQGYTIWGQY